MGDVIIMLTVVAGGIAALAALQIWIAWILLERVERAERRILGLILSMSVDPGSMDHEDRPGAPPRGVL